MLNWIKRILGIAAPEPQAKIDVEAKVEVVKAEKPKKTTTPKPKKATKPKKEVVDLAAMKKPELLAHAKTVGAKANASMKKEDIIAAIKNAA